LCHIQLFTNYYNDYFKSTSCVRPNLREPGNKRHICLVYGTYYRTMACGINFIRAIKTNITLSDPAE